MDFCEDQIRKYIECMSHSTIEAGKIIIPLHNKTIKPLKIYLYCSLVSF